MGRPVRVEFPGATYHAMSHGVDGSPTFMDDLDRERFLDILRELVSCGRLVVHAFCLMGNHFHLLCETPLGKLSRWMQQLLCKYTLRFNRRHKRTGHLWQARYKAVLVQDRDYFLHCSRYIHLNPVKAGMVRKPEEYRWSSYAAYPRSETPTDWIARQRTLGCFASPADYIGFVREGIGSDLDNPLQSASGGIAFGDEAFVKWVRVLVREPGWPDDADGFRELTARDSYAPAAVGHLVESLFANLSNCQKGRVFIYCLRRFTVLTCREIATLTGRTPAAVSHACRSIQERSQDQAIFKKRLELLERELAITRGEPFVATDSPAGQASARGGGSAGSET